MDARQPLRVAEPRGVSDDHAPVHVELRHRVQTAHRDGLGAVADQLATLEELAHEGVRLELLRHQVRVVVGVLGVERRDEAVRHEVVLHVVEPHAPEGVQQLVGHHAVDHPAGLVLLRPDPPDLLDAGLVDLGIPAVQVEAFDELLGERAAHAFAEHRDLGEDVHARLVGRLGLAVLVDAHVARAHADDAVALDEELVAGEAGVDLDADLLALLGEPLADVADRRDVVALLLEEGGIDRRAHGELRQEEVGHVVGADVLGRESLLDEVRHQLADGTRVDRCAREEVIAHRGAFLDHQHCRRLDGCASLALGALVVALDLLREVVGGRERCRAGSHEQDIDLHALAFGLTHRGLR